MHRSPALTTNLRIDVVVLILLVLIGTAFTADTSHVQAQETEPATTTPVANEEAAQVPAAPEEHFNPKKYAYKRNFILNNPVTGDVLSFLMPASLYQSIGAKRPVAVLIGASIDGEAVARDLSYRFERVEPTIATLTPEDAYRSAGTLSYVFPLRQFMGSAAYKRGLVPVGSDLEVVPGELKNFSGTISLSYTTAYRGREFTYWQQLATGLPLWINKDYFGINRTINQYDLQALFTNPVVKRDEEVYPYLRVTLVPDTHYADDADLIGFAARTHEPAVDQPAKAILIQSEESTKASSERIYIYDSGEAALTHYGMRLTIRDTLYAGTVSIETSNNLDTWTFRGRDVLASSPNQNTQFEKYFTTYKPTSDRYIRLTIKSLKGSVRPTDSAELMTDRIIASISTKNLIMHDNVVNGEIFYSPNQLYGSAKDTSKETASEAEVIDGSTVASAFVGPEEKNPVYVPLDEFALEASRAGGNGGSINGLIRRLDLDLTQDQTAAIAGSARQYREPIILGIIALIILVTIGVVVRPKKPKHRR